MKKVESKPLEWRYHDVDACRFVKGSSDNQRCFAVLRKEEELCDDELARYNQ